MKTCIYFAIFLSSIIGVQIGGISLNKMALIPLEIILLLQPNLQYQIKNVKRNRMHLVMWYCIAIFASLGGFLFAENVAYIYKADIEKKELYQVIQSLLIYIPIIVLIPNKIKKRDTKIIIKDAFIITARIQTIWAIIQFFLYYVLSFDLNKWLFVDVLKNASEQWTRFNNIGGVILLRPTGLNQDAAFLGILLIVGSIFDTSYIWKILYVLVGILSFSRATLITMLALLAYRLYKKIRGKLIIIRLNNILKILIVFGLILIVFGYLYVNVPFINTQINRMILRLTMISSGQDGTAKHMSYPKVATEIYLFNMPIYTKLFGIGLPITGVAFNAFSNYIDSFTMGVGYIDRVWTIECDYATTLIGTGIVGLFIYYSFYLKLYKNTRDLHIKELIICIVIYGVMYNLAGITNIQFLLWMIAISNENTKVGECKHENSDIYCNTQKK